VHRRLTRRISGADEVDVESLRDDRLAPCRAVVDAFSDEPVDVLDGEPTPRDAAREDQRPRPNALAPVPIEKDLARRRIDAGGRGA